MLTDKIPRKATLKDEYRRSDELRTIALPALESLRPQALIMERALAEENKKDLQAAANRIATTVASSFAVAVPGVRVLGVRPQEVTETSVTELFGDYDPETAKIRLWMRTAVLRKPTSFGTFLSTLCHELCHHLDVAHFDLPETYHTRGFYERAGLLYHHIRATPPRRLVWKEQNNGTYRIDWPETMRGSAK